MRHEIDVLRALQRSLAEHLALARAMHNVGTEAIHHLPAHSEQTGAIHVCAILLARLLDDLTVCVLLAEHGYPLQALSLCAGMLERGNAVAFIGNDDTRAQKWLSHDDPEHSYPRTKEAIQATARFFGATDDDARREYDVNYRQLCMAKHGNPMALSQIGVSMTDDIYRLHVGPYDAPAVRRALRTTLTHAVRYTCIAARVYVESHVAPSERRLLNEALADVATELDRLRAIDLLNGSDDAHKPT